MICDDQPKLDIRQLWLEGYKSLTMDGVRIPITTTPCNFGGERRWFLCPDCGRRCAVLYKPDYRCRLCRKGRYWIERFSPLDRKILKSRKLRRGLGQAAPGMAIPVPPKPTRMHWRTYRKICGEIIALETEDVMHLSRRTPGLVPYNAKSQALAGIVDPVHAGTIPPKRVSDQIKLARKIERHSA